MSYNDYMYAVERNGEYLEHYGVKGMKWGVRKALESGNARKLDRAYRKASRKLAKLEKRAANGSKYAKRAAALGAGAAAAGTLAVVGTSGVSKAVRRGGKLVGNASVGIGNALNKGGEGLRNAARGIGNQKIRQAAFNTSAGMRRAGTAMSKANMAGGVTSQAAKTANKISRWGKSNSIGGGIADKMKADTMYKINMNGFVPGTGNKAQKAAKAAFERRSDVKALRGVSNNTIARAGAAAVGAGLAGAAGYNAYRAATTKKAAQQAQQWRKEMNSAFKGTKYANGGSGNSSSGNRSRNRRRKRK